MNKYWLIIILGCFATALTADQNTILESQKSDEVKKQASGEYPEFNREVSVPLAAIQNAWNNAPRGAGVYIINFTPRETIRLTLREFMTTSIIFPSWEKIKRTLVGDENNYQVIQPEDNIVSIRPSSYVGLDTSLTVFGESGHVYGFYIRTEGYNSEQTSDITVRINVAGPLLKNTPQPMGTPEERTDYLEEAHSGSSHLNFMFSMSGDKTIAPNLVYSDGIRTWFDYGDELDRKRIPSFYSVIDGAQQAINVSIEDNRLVADRSGTFVLKSGKKTTCIYPTKSKSTL